MRIILFTGKGGVGKTSVAAATAFRASAAGLKTLVMSTDPAHSLSDSIGADIGSEPTEIEASSGMWAQQVDAQQRLESGWKQIREYAVELLSWLGVSSLEAEELSVIPGLDEIFSLADLKEHAAAGVFDLVIVDCAPTAETMRLLSLPEVLSWYIERVFPVERKIVNAVRPVLGRMKSLPPMATDDVFAAVDRFYRRIDGIKAVMADPEVTSIRLVVNPEKMVIAEAERTLTYLSLFGYAVDAVVVNRILPEEVSDPYFDRWRVAQTEHLQRIDESFSPIPILKARLFEQEMTGPRSLLRFGEEIYGDLDPAARLHTEEVTRVVPVAEGRALEIKLPFATQDQIDLNRRGDELFVKVGSFKRTVRLPHLLQSRTIKGASMKGSWLRITFV